MLHGLGGCLVGVPSSCILYTPTIVVTNAMIAGRSNSVAGFCHEAVYTHKTATSVNGRPIVSLSPAHTSRRITRTRSTINQASGRFVPRQKCRVLPPTRAAGPGIVSYPSLRVSAGGVDTSANIWRPSVR